MQHVDAQLLEDLEGASQSTDLVLQGENDGRFVAAVVVAVAAVGRFALKGFRIFYRLITRKIVVYKH